MAKMKMKKDTDNDGMKKGGKVKKMASGGKTRADGKAIKGHTKGKMV